jgi:hypothetical protein
VRIRRLWFYDGTDTGPAGSENREPNLCECLGNLRHRNTQAERGRLAAACSKSTKPPPACLDRAYQGLEVHRAARRRRAGLAHLTIGIAQRELWNQWLYLEK